MATRVLIVGASLAGFSVAEALREQDDRCEILMVGDEASPPYDRPPLSKQALSASAFGQQDCLVRPAAWYPDHSVQLRTGLAAVHLDPAGRVVTFADGSSQEADHVVIATGARPRQLPGWAPSSHIRYLRTLEDAIQLREALGKGSGRLCVIGAGFIGLEVACAAATAGWSVTVLEAGESPMSRVLPEEVARLCVQPVLELGVQLRCGETALMPEETSFDTRTVRLSSGERLTADLFVVGVGALPNTEWLADSGVQVDSGVVCDPSGQTSHQGVWAVGDAARWLNPVTGFAHRVEHWQAAREQGQVVAQRLSGKAAAWASPPYFWSDLARSKVQFLGVSSPEWRAHVVRDGRRTLCLIGDERLRGILTISHPRKLALGRGLVMARVSFEDGLRWAAA